MGEIRIGKRTLGPGRPVYFIAEAGSNHNRELGMALKLIDVAAEAGADAVKFQTFRADKLYARGAGRSDYLNDGRSIYDIVRDLELPLEWLSQLAAHAESRGMDFLSTPFDELSADALAPLVPAFKIASYEMTHYGLVQHCARKGKPLIVSTGTANLDEVREMVKAVRAVGCRDLIVLQCTAKYPAPLTALNVNALRTLAVELGVLVGLSDHSRQALPGPMAATALGAAVIEKHFTLDNNLPGPDHRYALEPAELAQTVKMVRAVEEALGSGIKQPQPEELELRAFARRSIFTTEAVPAGGRLTRRNCAVLRCGKLSQGLAPGQYMRILGSRARSAFSSDHPITLDELSPPDLDGDETTLRPIATEDGERIVNWRARPEISSQLFSERAPTLEEHAKWFENLQRRTDRLEFIISHKGVPVGTIGLSEIDFGKATAEYGILIGQSELQGRGVASAASRLILTFAFEVLDLESVLLLVFADNERALRLYERLGFVRENGAPETRQKDGVNRAVVRMSLHRKAWKV